MVSHFAFRRVQVPSKHLNEVVYFFDGRILWRTLLAEEIDREVKRLVEEAKETAREILTKNRDKIEVIVAELLLKETIEKERFEELLGKKELPQHLRDEEDKEEHESSS